MKLRHLIILTVLLAAQTATAQRFGYRAPSYHRQSYDYYGSKGKKWLKREYISIGMPFMNFQFSARYQDQPLGGFLRDTGFSVSKMSSGSYGLSCGSFGAITRLNEKQMIALDWSFGCHSYQWNLGDMKYANGDVASLKATSLLFEIPFALLYKSGGEVGLDPKQKALFSIGAGIAPSFAFTTYQATDGDPMSGVVAKVRTFLMMEGGMHFGIAMKIRATYYPGQLIMINKKDGDLETGQFTWTATGSGNFLLSLIFLPYSHRWGDDNGY